MEELVNTWLEEYVSALNSGSVEDGLALFAENAVSFGTSVNWSRYIPEYARKHGEPIFGGSAEFEISEVLSVVPMGESAFCAILWKDKSTEGGSSTERTGRASFVLQIQDENFVAIHSHFSEFPVVG